MSEWKKFGSPDWPHWGDEGKRVQVKYRDATEAEGVLVMEDMTPGPDELPLFTIRKDDGMQASWFDAEFWRYVEASVSLANEEAERRSRVASGLDHPLAPWPKTVKYDHSISVDFGKVDQLASEIATAQQENRRRIAFQWLKANAYFARMSGNQDVERIDALLSALDAVAWQPIETAPKDRKILLYDPSYGGLHDPAGEGSIFVGQFSGGWADGDFDMQPTHWMPLAEPPK